MGIWLRLLMVVLSSASAVLSETPDYKVGVILGLTGDGSTVGNNIKDGLTLGLGDLPEADQRRIILKIEDDQLKPAFSVAALQRLGVRGLDLLINASAPTSQALAPLAEQAGVPFISLSSDARLARKGAHTFLFWPLPERLSEKAVEQCEAQQIRRVAIVTTQNEGRYYVRDQFRGYSRGRVDIVVEEEFAPDVRDFRSFITRISKRNDIDGIFINLFFGQIGSFARQARELGVTWALFGVDIMADPREIDAAQGALKNQWYVGGFQGAPEFLTRFQRAFPRASSLGAAQGYDLARIIHSIISAQDKGQSSDTVLTPHKEFQGVLGQYHMRPDRRFDLPVEVRKIES